MLTSEVILTFFVGASPLSGMGYSKDLLGADDLLLLFFSFSRAEERRLVLLNRKSSLPLLWYWWLGLEWLLLFLLAKWLIVDYSIKVYNVIDLSQEYCNEL